MKLVRSCLLALAATVSATAFTFWSPMAPVTTAEAAECTGSVGPGIPPPATVPSGLPGFHANWFGQSGYPTLCPGEQSTAVVAYYNSGSLGWVSNKMGEMAFLGTWEPSPGQDKFSLLGGDGTNGSPSTGWPRYNRVAAQPADYVGPGQVSWFQFKIQAPQAPGTYKLYIRPLIEGAQWMEDFGVFWQVTVKSQAVVPVSVTPTDNTTIAIDTSRSYVATLTGLSGCVDLAFVDANTYPGDGTFRDMEGGTGNDKADLTSDATFATVNGVSVGGTFVNCVAIPADGKIQFTISSGTANANVRPLVFQDSNGNNALDLNSDNRPTETDNGVGGATRFIPPSAPFGNQTVTVGTVNLAEDFFTAGSSTFRYDSNDTFQYSGTGITLAQFEQVISSGDTVEVRYNPDTAGTSTFNITTDVGRMAPTVTTTVDSYDGGATKNDVLVTITEPSSNIDGNSYSVQRATAAATTTTCDATAGTYTELTTIQVPNGSNAVTYTDPNRSNGTYCYRIGTLNPVTGTTAFGYSNPAIVAVP
ncbi:MAG TPA: hypothetical protein VGS01_00655 [Candidatus Limnocylindria bacterium]|nr:hypothetical protein [Candidatus Limnocylindria bacterium]